MEKDASGTFVGSSFIFAPGRDWARFGLLMLNKGNWQGKQILSEEWVKFVTTPTPAAPLGEYGAQWWLNAGSAENPQNKRQSLQKKKTLEFLLLQEKIVKIKIRAIKLFIVKLTINALNFTCTYTTGSNLFKYFVTSRCQFRFRTKWISHRSQKNLSQQAVSDRLSVK